VGTGPDGASVLTSDGQLWSAWQGISRTQADCLVTARQGVVLVVADLPGDLAEAGRDEAGRALRHRDIGTGDGVQVEVLVQGAEDAVRLSGAGWVAGVTGSRPVNGILQCGAVPSGWRQ
jgi:hypothetical protein